MVVVTKLEQTSDSHGRNTLTITFVNRPSDPKQMFEELATELINVSKLKFYKED